MKLLLLFLLGGGLYVLLEIFWRGYSHVSMFIAGGASLTLLTGIFLGLPELPVLAQCLLGTLVITSVEFITGAVVNVEMGLHVWDYSQMRCNLYGQVCLRYSLLWFGLCAPAGFVVKLVNAL